MIFREVRRVLKPNATLWVNIGDSSANDGKWGGMTGGKQAYLDERSLQRVGREKRFTGLKPKDLVGIPWELAFALRADGWWLRQEIIWHKLNPMPESAEDRPTRAHEQIFLLSKSKIYYYDFEAIKEPASADTHARYARGRGLGHKYADGGPGGQTIAQSYERMRKPAVNPKADQPQGQFIKQNSSFSAAVKDVVEFRNKRSVWTTSSEGFPGAHFATYPRELIAPAVLAGCPPGGIVLDPFCGSGTSGVVALALDRGFVGIELKPEYADMARKRIVDDAPLFNMETVKALAPASEQLKLGECE